MRYEPEWMNVKAAGWFIVCFLTCLTLILLGMLWVQGDLLSRELRTSVAAARDLAPEPRLQSGVGHMSTEAEDDRSMVAEQQTKLNTYGKAEGESSAGFVRIPISEAMKIFVEKQ